MLTINMFSAADRVEGQGVGSAYLELMSLLSRKFPNTFDVRINKWTKSDITHYHTVNFSYYLSTFFKKARGRKIGYVHFIPETLEGSLDLPWIAKVVFYRYLVAFYKRMDHLVVVNPSFIEELVKLGIAEEKITYIPNFVSDETFYAYDEATKLAKRQEKGYKRDDFIVLGAGQIQERKGVDDFVRLALAHPETKFVWAGGFSFGKWTGGYVRYKEMVENAPENLRFTGIISREELTDYYNCADLFFLPSHNELFPMCILEAFHCGTAVMLRDLSLYHAIIQDHYYPVQDYAEMDQAITELAANPAEVRRLEKASSVAAERYSEENLAKTWSNFYMEQAALHQVAVYKS